MIKKLLYILLVIMVLSLATNVGYIYTYADTVSSSTGIIDPNKYKPSTSTNPEGADRVKDFANMIVGVIQVVGTIISVAVLIVLGMKYMVGGVEERAEYKKTMLPYVIGALLLFGITNILGIIVNIADEVF